MHQPQSSSSRGSSSGLVPDKASVSVSDEDIEEAWYELEEKRKQWELEGLDLGEDFTTQILGGRWTRVHKGKAYDAIVGFACKGPATLWARQYGFNVLASFSNRKHGEARASAMAIEWCRVMQHWCDIYRHQDIPTYHYSDHDLQSLEECLDFVNMVLEAGVESPMWPRAQAIRHLRPSAPKCSAASSSSKGDK